MGNTTNIEWADGTWNPWTGCDKVSAGCANCYMFREMARYGKNPKKVVRTSAGTFDAPLKWARLRKLHDGARIFTCSWSDFWIEEADVWRQDAWNIIKATPQFTYLIPTKRPERIEERLPEDWGPGYPNVWFIVSAENQAMYTLRWNILKDIPAVVKGISAEPLLGAITMFGDRPDWIITGGESGHNPRVTPLDLFRDLRDQCIEKGIPYFHKQHGGKMKIDGAYGGRVLDGKKWDEFPGQIKSQN